MVAVGGLSGTGKSVLARALAPTLAPPPGAVVIRSDVERKALFGKGELEPLPQEAYTPEMTARVYAAIAEKARRTVAAGHSAILDAVFARPDEREQAERAASDARRAFPGAVPRSRCGDARATGGDARARRLRRQCRGGARAGDATISARSTWHRVDASGTPRRDLAARQGRAGMNGAAPLPIDKLARGTAVGLAGYLHLHQSLFAAGAAAVAGGGILGQRRRHQRHHDRRHAGGRAHRAVQRRGGRRDRAQARDHRRRWSRSHSRR